MKVAIMLIGHIRSWNKGCKESFIQKFNKYNPDVYVITYDVINENFKEKLKKEEIEDIFKDINVVKLEIKDQDEVYIETKKYENFCNHEDKNIFRRMLCQSVNLKNCFTMIEESGKEYDFIIKTRFDLIYNFEPEDIFVKNRIITSGSHSACDFFACSDPGNMKKYSSIIDKVENLYNKYFKPDIEVSPHMILHYHLLGGYTNHLNVSLIRL